MRIAFVSTFALTLAVLAAPALADNDSVPRMSPGSDIAPRAPVTYAWMLNDATCPLSGIVVERLSQARQFIQMGNMASALKETDRALSLNEGALARHAAYGYQYYIYQKQGDQAAMGAVVRKDRALNLKHDIIYRHCFEN